jgi:hypothetical protein
MRLLKVLALSVLLTFVFNALLILVAALVGWDSSLLTVNALSGAKLFESSGADWLWVFFWWGFALMQSSLLLLPLPVASA